MRTLDELGISPAPWSEICGCVIAGRREGELGREQLCELDNAADARLIASAPMLYECLREAVIESCHECPAYRNGKCESSVEKACFVRKWHDALASASGESEVAK